MADELTKEEIWEYKKAFAVFDKDGNGSITVEELRNVMESLGQQGSDEELENEMREMDLDGNGEIDFEEFLTVMPRMKRKAEIRNAFRVFDPDNDGVIRNTELVHALLTLVKGTEEKDIVEMIKHADTDGDGKIKYEELIQLIINT